MRIKYADTNWRITEAMDKYSNQFNNSLPDATKLDLNNAPSTKLRGTVFLRKEEMDALLGFGWRLLHFGQSPNKIKRCDIELFCDYEEGSFVFKNLSPENIWAIWDGLGHPGIYFIDEYPINE